jgi:hypothetical protein
LSTGAGTTTFETEFGASKAIDFLNDKIVNGREIKATLVNPSNKNGIIRTPPSILPTPIRSTLPSDAPTFASIIGRRRKEQEVTQQQQEHTEQSTSEEERRLEVQKQLNIIPPKDKAIDN